MNLNPIDIRHQEFKKVLRGFDPVEVVQYLNEVADSMEKVLHENEEFDSRLREIKSKLESYANIEDAISQTLVDTKKSAKNMLDNARQESELIIKRANADADEIIRKASEKTIKLRYDLNELENKKAALVAELRSILQAHLQLLDSFERKSNSVIDEVKNKSNMTDEDVDRITEEHKTGTADSSNID